jgi:hypothetical protein
MFRPIYRPSSGVIYKYNILLLSNCYVEPLTYADSLNKRPKLRNVDMRYSTWNVKSFYRAHSLMTVWKERSTYLAGEQEDRWEAGGTEPAG